MSFPGHNLITPAFNPLQKAEVQQGDALLQGYLETQHKQDGSHAAVTADSVTVTGDISANGNVTADADGGPVITGALAATGGFSNAVNGVDMKTGTTSRWRIGTTASSGSTHQLFFEDILGTAGAGGFTWRIYYDGTNYVLDRDTGVGMALGQTSRAVTTAFITKVNAQKVAEIGGTVIGEYDVEIIADNGTFDLPAGDSALGNLHIIDMTGLTTYQILLRGSSHAVVEISNPTSAFTVTAANAGTTNVFWNAGTNKYRIENKTGSQRTYKLFLVGSGLWT